MLKRFARTVEVEVAPDQFVFRTDRHERSVPTHGFIRQAGRREPAYVFDEVQRKPGFVPISLFGPLDPKFREEFIDILAAYLVYGVGPLCNLVRPILVFKGVERFQTRLGFEYAVFRAAGKLAALNGKEVHFQTAAKT